jgi:LysM repeat protein
MASTFAPRLQPTPDGTGRHRTARVHPARPATQPRTQQPPGSGPRRVRRHGVPDRTAHPSSAARRGSVVGVVLAVAVACGVVLAHDVLADPSGVPASAASGRSAPQHVTVVARPGDTLWSIAETYRGSISITRYVDLLVRVNGGPSIEAGQVVVLP